jgi:predicted O-methyltransferase YrrM
MSTSQEEAMNAVKNSFLSAQTALYRAFLPNRILQTLDTMLRDESPVGFTDWTALSYLSAMIKVCQPANVLQLGTHIGFSAIIFAGLLPNDKCKIYTVEPVKLYHEKAKYYAQKAGVIDRIEFLDGFSTDSNIIQATRNHGPYNFIYIDTSHSCSETLKELKAYVEDERFTTRSTFIALHDVGSQAVKADPTGVRGGIEQWLKTADNSSRYQMFILDAPLYPNVNGLGIIGKLR